MKTIKKKPTKNNKQKNNSTIDNYERVNICLTCTKPAKDCKGNCFGRSNQCYFDNIISLSVVVLF